MLEQRTFLAAVVAGLAWSGAGLLPQTAMAEESENGIKAVNYGRSVGRPAERKET